MEILGDQISQLPKAIESQTYYPTESKQKQMYLSKIEGYLTKLGRPMMADQRAYSKVEVKNMKFSEVDKILNQLPPRIDSQSAYAPGRSLVERNNSERDLNALAAVQNAQSVPLESKTMNSTMKERRKSIQSSLGSAIAKLSGTKSPSRVNSNGEIEKNGSEQEAAIQKSNFKKEKGSQEKLADISPVSDADSEVPHKAGFFQRVSMLVSGVVAVPDVSPVKDGPEVKRASITGRKIGNSTATKSPSAPLQNAVHETSDGVISIVENRQTRLNDQAAEGLNINDDKQRDIINIVQISKPVMASQRAEKRKSYIIGISHSDL